MATGACGINCDVCRLNLQGLCTTCGSGKSHEASVKLATQKRILGDTCPILACACMNQKSYCLRGCSQFPCDNFSSGPYPFSEAYLEMQRRRRREWAPRTDPLGKPVEIPDAYWEDLQKKDKNIIGVVTDTRPMDDNRIGFHFLDLSLIVDADGRQVLEKQKDGSTPPVNIPLLTLTVLIYFNAVNRLYPMGKDLISTEDMGGQGNYFTGHHQLKTENVLRRFRHDAKGFAQAAKALGGSPVDMGDAGWVLYPFPRVAVYYLFWDLDNEHDPRLSILFDRPVKDIFTPPMIWELVNLVNGRLLSV